MFDVSWGELFVLTGLGITFIGRKDLPAACRLIGSQLGRVVGLLQGARVRADRYAASNELRHLQNELRAGLRELDAVRSELATSTAAGLMGRGLGPTVVGANRSNKGIGGNQRVAMGTTVPSSDAVMGRATTAAAGGTGGPSTLPVGAAVSPSDIGVGNASAATTTASGRRGVLPASPSASSASMGSLAPRSQSIAAVAEMEWERRGIGFKSVAEMGGKRRGVQDPAASTSGGGYGSSILADFMQESLIYDQYERVVREQDEILQSRADKIRKIGKAPAGGNDGTSVAP